MCQEASSSSAVAAKPTSLDENLMDKNMEVIQSVVDTKQNMTQADPQNPDINSAGMEVERDVKQEVDPAVDPKQEMTQPDPQNEHINSGEMEVDKDVKQSAGESVETAEIDHNAKKDETKPNADEPEDNSGDKKAAAPKSRVHGDVAASLLKLQDSLLKSYSNV